MRALLSRAAHVPETELGDLAVSLARLVFLEARQTEAPSERRQRETLSRLLSSPKSQALSVALTDRACRSSSSKRQVSSIVEVSERVGIDKGLPLLDRIQLRALVSFGAAVPKITAEAVAARLAREASPFVLDAEENRLTDALAKIRSGGRRVNLNYLGEEILGEADAERRTTTYLELLDRGELDALSVKLSGVYSQINLLAPDVVCDSVISRLGPVLLRATEKGVLVYFDMEAYRDLSLTVQVLRQICESSSFSGLSLGVALQAYLPDSARYLEEVLELAVGRVAQGAGPLRLRLVKGANLATESVEASLHRLTCPIFETKREVDANMKRLLSRVLRPELSGKLRVGLGSHNLFDQCYGLLLARHRGIASMLDLEMLEGMAGSTGRVLTELAGGALFYAPAVKKDNFPAAVSYLVRRLDENTGPENFLRTSVFMKPGDEIFQKEAEGFLSALELSKQEVPGTFRTQDRSRPLAHDVPGIEEEPFDNCADTDWTRPQNRDALRQKLDEAASSTYEITSLLAGKELSSEELAFGSDPSKPDRKAYSTHIADATEVEQCIAATKRAERTLAELNPRERAQMVARVGDELEKERLHLVALMVLDAGKRPAEADIEVSEAVDFSRYYAQNYLALLEEYELTPRGLTVVTPPFNFPLAIPLGGCLAALVSGNPVILKPAPETRLVAWAAARCLYRAGIPPEAFSLLLCDDNVASPLIKDERVRTVVLTGASATARAFLKARPDLHLLAETGGKNGMFVSALSDRDAAIRAATESAFGHAGQKCSALSQLILEDEVYFDEAFKETLIDATASLRVGSAWDLSSFVTPLIRPPEGPLERILHSQPEDRGGAAYVLQPRIAAGNPQLVSPGILWGVKAGSFPHQTEFFGPVLSVLRAKDVKEGLSIINGTPYGLTAGFFGLSESEQSEFASGIQAGNVYFNRGITGAVVGRQPFGGLKESSFGPGSKAGGPNYVLQFCHVRAKKPRRVAQGSELISRRGTPVVGEENILRYLPANTVLVIGEGAKDSELAITREARRFAGAKSTEVRLSQSATPAECEMLGKRGALWIRVLGVTPASLLSVAAERGWTVLSDPVSEDLRIELRYFSREQSLSIAYHRHGNLGLRGIHPLLSELPELAEHAI